MLIDANHPEETRVVVLDGQRVEEFDFEAASKRPLKGNIYLAKVTRVEPSLQAAFVEYGGNRQGFLAFSEIHPDYYQIPVADRLALLADQEAEARERHEDDFESFEIKAKSGEQTASSDDDEEEEEDTSEENGEGGSDNERSSDENHSESDADERSDESNDSGESEPTETALQGDSGGAELVPEGEEKTPAQAADSKRPSGRWMKRRHYKIQEVIKRRQIILVQVVKEERGNKGAALTTYLSLAGRYCVLMPNTPRGGGISRKITNATDRKRLKAAAQALDLPEGMGLIIRTAGENRTKLEIKRDYEYLLRLWDTIRETTLRSNAPSCVYEEGDLIKRAIRDLYNKDVTEVIVEGEDGYRNAKDFMRMLMPSHAKNVKQYKEPVPLFQRHHIEAQLDAMFSSTVTLKSGGYIVINQTEALVAIDVNSGRSTREHNIEDTATKTNLEAADEVGRQLRLRDLAGLIVIDFIDMEDSRNDRSVEKRLHNAVKNDRARIQIGKISQFGLLELSRQRLRAGVVAGSTVPCPHCGGQGIVRSVESTSLRVLRGLEEEAQKQRCEGMVVRAAADVGFYTLNQKRMELARLENEYEVLISFEPQEGLKVGDFEIDRFGVRDPATRPRLAVFDPPPEMEQEEEPEEYAEEIETEAETETEAPVQAASEPVESSDGKPEQPGDAGRRRRRRRRRGGRGRENGGEGRENEPREAGHDATESAVATVAAPIASTDNDSDEESEGEAQQAFGLEGQSEGQPAAGPAGEGGRRRRRRRRGRRGGRDGEPRETETGSSEQAADPSPLEQSIAVAPTPAVVPPPVKLPPVTPASFFEDRYGNVDEIDTTPRDEPVRAPISAAIPNAASAPVFSLEPAKTEPVKAEPVAKPVVVEAPVVAAPAPAQAPAEPAQPAKKGWWQRAFKAE
jgi:ribonuclease E